MRSTLRFKNKLFYGWVVVATFFVIGITLYGIQFSFGIFFKSIESEFNLTRTATSAISSANLLLAGICAFFGGWALDRYGPRVVVLLMGILTGLSLSLTSQTNALWQLFITYSLMLAMGTGPLYVVPMSAVSRWFDKKRGLALALASLGIGLGMVVMAPFATYAITKFDWRMAYLVIGLIAWLVVIPLSRLLKKDPREIGALPDGEKSYAREAKSEESSVQPVDSSLLPVFQTRSFWILLPIWFLFASCLFLVLTHLVPHVTDIGFSAGEAAAVLSLIGMASIPGRLVMGVASDRIGRKLAIIICTLLQSGAMVWLIWAQDLWMFYLFAVVFGFAYSGSGSSMAAIIGDTFGLGQIGAIFGLLEVGFGVGAAIGPAMGGLIFDISHSYTIAFLIGAVVMLVATLLVTLIRRETNTNFGSGNTSK
ncbi:MAG TPA: MFS transporter [Dehalococcoidales bacterium]|nr:MFS transporter [Dehalococcoidales bacterium]